VDVSIQIAPLHPPTQTNGRPAIFQHSVECSRIRIEGIADFEIKGGKQIRVWPALDATQKDIEIILSGPAWATLCHQRGMLPLHASAILTKKGISAFAGHSGAGKSTTAALLNSMGYGLAADDILSVSFNTNSVPGAWPYIRRLKLQRESIAQLGLSASESVSERLDKDKYFVLPKYACEDRWSRLDRLYLLEMNSSNSRMSIDRITGADAVRALIDQTYHYRFIQGIGRMRDHLSFCTQLASKIPIYRLRRSESLNAGKELGSVVCAHLEDASI
jgi:hypothetical protein